MAHLNWISGENVTKDYFQRHESDSGKPTRVGGVLGLAVMGTPPYA